MSVTERTVAIVGTGYVGMASAIGFAELGHRVLGYDILPERIDALKRGVTPYREAGIDEALRVHLDTGRIAFSNDLAEVMAEADFAIIAVGTPAKDDGSADMSYVESAVRNVIAARRRATILVLRSTVPAGTTERLANETGVDFLYAPEFLREGSAVADFLNPDRIVVGTRNNEAGNRYASLMASLDRPVLLTNYRNAELIKGFSNAFLALKVSFANEVANMCDALDADAHEVLGGVGYDRRIGRAFLSPGIGFGGPCFEKDVKSLHHVAGQHGIGRTLLAATLTVNEAQPRLIVDMLESELGTLDGAHIGIWGLAFKAGTDDVRDSLALRILADLKSRNATFTAYDPSVKEVAAELGCTMASSAHGAIDGTDALLVLTEWPEFRDVQPWSVKSRLRRGVVVDGRNVLDPDAYAGAGLRYRGVGRRPSGDVDLAAVS